MKSLKQLFQEQLTVETLSMIVIAMDIPPAIQRALVVYVWMDKTPAETLARTGVYPSKLHYHMAKIKRGFIREGE